MSDKILIAETVSRFDILFGHCYGPDYKMELHFKPQGDIKMNFQEALTKLKSGTYVKRSDWQDGYLVLMPQMSYLWRILLVPQVNAGNYLPTVADLIADDWVEYTAPVPAEAPGFAAAKPGDAVPDGAQT